MNYYLKKIRFHLEDVEIFLFANNIDYLKEYTEKQVDKNYLNDYNIRHLLYPFNTPQTKEAFYYRVIFEELFPNRAETVKGWIPKMDWDGVNSDPSGRAQSTHTNTTV